MIAIHVDAILHEYGEKRIWKFVLFTTASFHPFDTTHTTHHTSPDHFIIRKPVSHKQWKIRHTPRTFILAGILSRRYDYLHYIDLQVFAYQEGWMGMRSERDGLVVLS